MTNPFKMVQNVCTTVLTILFLYWFGTGAFKLGFYANETPILSPLVRTLIKNNNHENQNNDSLLNKTWKFINSQEAN